MVHICITKEEDKQGKEEENSQSLMTLL